MVEADNRPPAPGVDQGVTRALPADTVITGDTLLDGRYHLHTLVTQRGLVSLWRGDDQILARAVAVRVVEHVGAPSGPPPAEREEAAQRLLSAGVNSGRLVHPGAASTYDATTTSTPYGPVSYVVTEWVDGATLDDLLGEAPLRPDRAAGVVLAVARVVAAAHARGVHHGDLHPGDVLVTRHGAVKVTDIEVGAAVAELDGGTEPQTLGGYGGRADYATLGSAYPDGNDDPALRDVRALGAVLYATLTGRWPFGSGRGLPAAPLTPDGRLCAPRQVRAGVPRDLDALVLATLADPRAARPPVVDASEVVRALEALTPTETPHEPELPPYGDDERSPAPTGRFEPVLPPESDGRRRRVLPWVVAALLAAVIAVVWYAYPRSNGGGPGPTASPTPSAGPTTGAPTTAVTPAQVTAFDPLGGGDEHNAEVPLAHDNNPATVWNTDTYRAPGPFGGLKSGVGLRVDFGQPVSARTVALTLAGTGTSVEIRAGDTASNDVNAYQTVGSVNGAGSSATVPLRQTGAHRYWVIWLTNIPANADGFRGGIAEFAFRS